MDLSAWFGVLILLLALAFIPLSAWAATGSLSRAWQALRQYLLIIGAFVLIGGGAGVIAAISDHGLGPMWAAITGR